jgi:hypothetical protein
MTVAVAGQMQVALNPTSHPDMAMTLRQSDSRKIGLVHDGVWFDGDAPVVGPLADYIDQVRAKP